MKNKKLFLIIASGLLILALSVWALRKNPSSSESTLQDGSNIPAESINQAENNETATDSEAKEISLIARQWEFVPSTIQVQQGQAVRLVIKNQDVDHGFRVPGLNIDQFLPAGETTTVEFTADQTGTFPFSCSVYCGQGHSQMTGEIIVSSN